MNWNTMTKTFIFVVFILCLMGCNQDRNKNLSSYGIEVIDQVQISENENISLAYNAFESNYKNDYVSTFGQQSYELTYPFIIYDFDKDLLKTFDENNSIKEQMKNSSSFLFPVITNNNTLLDYQVNIANGVVEYFQPADLPTDLGQDNVQIKSLSTTIYTILEYNQLKKEDCYLVQMPYGPFVLFTNIDGEEFSIPLELALTNFNNVSKASTDEIKKRLLKMKELFADPQTFTPTSENAPAFNVFKITDVWYGLYEEIINTFQESK